MIVSATFISSTAEHSDYADGGTTPGSVAERRCLSSVRLHAGIDGLAKLTDKHGYIGLSDNGTLVKGGDLITSSSFYKTVAVDYSSTGEITYKVRLHNRPGPDPSSCDAPLLNIFGGVDTLGLWGLDLEGIRDTVSSGITVGLSYNPHYGYLDDPSVRKYKLFNKIVLTDNLVKMEGKDGIAGIFDHYKDIDIHWKVKFI